MLNDTGAGNSTTSGTSNGGPVTADGLRGQVRDFLAEHDPVSTGRLDFLRARFDAGLAWVHYPPGLGGQGLPRALQRAVDAEFTAAGAPGNEPERIVIGLGMAAPTILAFGTEEQKRRWLRPLWTGEEIWCQLFSEPGAGSDLASLATRAVRDQGTGAWAVTGQKVWTSSAHVARWALLVTRTDPDVPKHKGLTYFACDMTAPGVEVRPLRQITGEAEFNEVFLTDVPVPDADRIGEIGAGWQVSTATLMNERVAIGGSAIPREGGIAAAAATWREQPALRTAGLHDRLLRLWADAEVARLNQEISAFEVELAGEAGLRYRDWTMRRPEEAEARFYDRDPGYRYLRARGNSIEGGTSEILRNIIAERVLRLPPEIRLDKDVPWKDLPR